MTSFLPSGSALGTQDAQPCYLFDLEATGNTLTNQRQINWPVLGEESLFDITGNAHSAGLKRHPDTDTIYVLGDTGVSGPSHAPGQLNETASRVRLYEINPKTANATQVGKFGTIGGLDAVGDLAVSSSLGSEGRATNPVQGSDRLYVSVDLGTGAATSIGATASFPGFPIIYSLDVHPHTGELWALSLSAFPGDLKLGVLEYNAPTYTVKSTISPALNGSFFRTAMAFDKDGTLFVAVGGGSSNIPYRIARIPDPNDGIAEKSKLLQGAPASGQSVSGMCFY